MRRALLAVVCFLALPVAAASAQGNDAITSKVQFNDVLGMPLSNGCHYVATMKGSAAPERNKTGNVDANVTIDASLACPNRGIVHSVETVHEAAPLTRGQLAMALERGAAITSDASGTRCLYRPELRFDGGRLAAKKVDVICPPPAVNP